MKASAAGKRGSAGARKPGWQVRKLGEVCEMYQPKTISGKEMVADGAYPVYGANGVIGRYSQFNHEEPQLLITCRGATCGSVNISAPYSWVTGNAMVVRPQNGSMDLRFLEYLFRGGIDISKAITGAAQPQITRTNLSPLEISFPESLTEQQCIVAILDEAFAGLATAKANAEQNLANARALFESHLDAVFSQRGEGWVERRLSDLCDIKHGYAFDGKYFSNEGEYVLLTPGNFFEQGGYRNRGERQKFFTGEIPREFILNEGDLLVAMTEQAAGLLGSPIIVPESNKFLHNQRLGLVKKKSEIPWLNEFFFHVFNTIPVRHAIHAGASGVKVRHTSPSKIGEVVIAFPPALSAQKRIISKLDALSASTRRLAGIYARKVAALEELKQALLARAFAWEL